MGQSVTINGTSVTVAGKLPFSVEEAKQRFEGNGLDEIYFSADGETYVAFARGINSDNFPVNTFVNFLDGKQAKILDVGQDVNTAWEGIRDSFGGGFVVGGAALALLGKFILKKYALGFFFFGGLAAAGGALDIAYSGLTGHYAKYNIESINSVVVK